MISAYARERVAKFDFGGSFWYNLYIPSDRSSQIFNRGGIMTILFKRQQITLILTCPTDYMDKMLNCKGKTKILSSAMIKAVDEAEQKDPDWIVCSATIEGLTEEDLNMEIFKPIDGMEGYWVDLG